MRVRFRIKVLTLHYLLQGLRLALHCPVEGLRLVKVLVWLRAMTLIRSIFIDTGRIIEVEMIDRMHEHGTRPSEYDID